MSIEIYAAGFFDGEGCIYIQKSKTSKLRSLYRYELFTVVSGTVERPLKYMQEHWGGSLRKYQPRNPKHRPFWRWALGGTSAAKFIKDIEPFLLVKFPIAKVGLRLNSHLRNTRFCTRNPATEEALLYREKLYLEAKELNRRGTREMEEVSL